MRLLIAAVFAVTVIALGACGDDESDQGSAQKQVCDARADIKRQLDELGSVRLDTVTVDGIKQQLNAIEQDLSEMRQAKGQLNEQRRAQVELANRAFRAKIESVVKDVRTSRSLSGALTALQNSLIALRDDYQQALAPIDCG
jgi:hypothetical protein